MRRRRPEENRIQRGAFMKWTRKYEALRLILAVLVCAAIPAVSMAESDGNPVEKFPPLVQTRCNVMTIR